MPASINASHSLPPASLTGREGAAPYIHSSASPLNTQAMTINGLDAAAMQKLAAEKAAAQKAAQNAAAGQIFATQAAAETALKAHLDSVRARADELSELGYRHEVQAFADTPTAKAASAAPQQAREALSAARRRVAEVKAAISGPDRQPRRR
jgi:hypothetical protein